MTMAEVLGTLEKVRGEIRGMQGYALGQKLDQLQGMHDDLLAVETGLRREAEVAADHEGRLRALARRIDALRGDIAEGLRAALKSVDPSAFADEDKDDDEEDSGEHPRGWSWDL